MPYQLECAQSFSSDDASEADINRAFDDDRIRGEFVILTAPNGSFIQAAGEGDGPYTLEYRDAATQEHVRAQGELTKEQVRAAFLEYLRGSSAWRSGWQWEPVRSSGCLSVLIVALMLVGAVVGGWIIERRSLRESNMNKDEITQEDNDLRPEYDLSTLKGGVRAKHLERYHAGTNLALLDVDVRAAFPTDEAVNQALRSLMESRPA
jgi:hypothetical protein